MKEIFIHVNHLFSCLLYVDHFLIVNQVKDQFMDEQRESGQ